MCAGVEDGKENSDTGMFEKECMKGNNYLKKMNLCGLGILTCGVLLFSGCGKIGTVLPNTSEVPSDSEIIVENASEIFEPDEESDFTTFAEKVVGNYSAELDNDEMYVLSIYNVYGNLYAHGAYAMKPENEENEPEVYSYFEMEIIPRNAGGTLDFSTNSVDVGILQFSGMSNLGNYWGEPYLGKLEITDDGIQFTAEGNGPFPAQSGEPFKLKNDPRVKGVYSYNTEAISGIDRKEVPEELFGIWKANNEKYSYILDIKKGSDNTIGGIQLYLKSPGFEAKLGRGFLTMDGEGVAHIAYDEFCDGGMPHTWEFTYEKADDGCITVSSLDETDMIGSYLGAKTSFSPITREDVPLVTFFEPDNVNAYKSEKTINAPDMTTRTLQAAFLSSHDIENNGGEFVRIGKLIFFRYFPNEQLPQGMMGYMGNFLGEIEEQDSACICYYSPATKKCGIACKDNASGPLYYVNGKFVSKRSEGGESYNTLTINTYYPDGSGDRVYDSSGSDVMCVSKDGKYFAFYNFPYGQVYLSDGFGYPFAYDPHSGEDMYSDGKFLDDTLLLMSINGESESVIFDVINCNDNSKVTYRVKSPSDNRAVYATLGQFTEENGKYYVGLNWIDSNKIVTYTVNELDPKTADPIDDNNEVHVIYNELPGEVKSSDRPSFVFNADDELVVNSSTIGAVRLSEGTYGDLIYYDSIYSAVVVASDFVKEYIKSAKIGDNITILQCAEQVDNAVYVITADMEVVEKIDSDDGMFNTFDLKGFDYICIPLDGVENSGEKYESVSLEVELPENYMSLSGDGTTANPVTDAGDVRFPGGTAKEAYEKVIACYRTAAKENWDEEKARDEGLLVNLWENGYSGSALTDGSVGYAYLDINKDGMDELLIITHDSTLAGIYGYNGSSAVYAVSVPYRHDAAIYDNGYVRVSLGTMKTASDTWYTLCAPAGTMLPIIMREYVPTTGEPEDVHCYAYCGFDGMGEIEKLYKANGNMPVFAYEWADELTEEEYDRAVSGLKEIKLPKMTSF